MIYKNKIVNMNSFDFFDEIYCINLDERVDRWEHAQNEFTKAGILDKVQRFSAIRDVDGRFGIIKSNLAIVKMAKEKKLKNVLIFEDDVEFIVDDPQAVLQTSINQVKDIKWHLFYLGANTHEKLIKFKPNLILLKNAFAVHSMAYSDLMYDTFIRKFDNLKTIRTFDDILDVYLAKQIQDKGVCLMVNPMMTTQMNSFSDIENRVVDYSFIEERYKNNIK
jgi:GR25 family glycosyltransferase involved in LPS biosynthesis